MASFDESVVCTITCFLCGIAGNVKKIGNTIFFKIKIHEFEMNSKRDGDHLPGNLDSETVVQFTRT